MQLLLWEGSPSLEEDCLKKIKVPQIKFMYVSVSLTLKLDYPIPLTHGENPTN